MCAASTRWLQYAITSSGSYHSGDGPTYDYAGTMGYRYGRSSVGDTFTMGPTTNRLYVKIDGETPSPSYITLYSGSALDPRFVAKNITELLHQYTGEKWQKSVCKWENVATGGATDPGNCFKIYSGTLGTASSVTVESGTNSAHAVLGFGTSNGAGGAVISNNYTGSVEITGEYTGFFDETYTVVVSNSVDNGIGTPTKGGSNTYNGTLTTGGVFTGASNITYTLIIDVTNGTTMGQGTGNVPILTWTSSSTDDSDVDTELLYPDRWYNIGDNGLMVKFSDSVFNTCNPAYTIACTAHQYAEGTNANAAVGTAYYVWGSDRGDDGGPIQTVSGTPTQLGSRGLNIKFGGGVNLYAKDRFVIQCSPPQPIDPMTDTTGVNFGNVTVSTESDVKCVSFEVKSGAAEVSAVKFGLQNHGTFSHHDAGNSDTYFHFGTVGAGQPTGVAPVNGLEWRTSVLAGDIDSDVAPSYLYATKADLAVVSTADASESVGSVDVFSDPIWIGIRLGASETGANASINFRLYFDYS